MRQFLFQSTAASAAAALVDPLTFNAHIIEIGNANLRLSSTEAKRS
jgi:hypothetical protein